MLDADALHQADRLQSRYVRALSLRDMHGWAACFDNPGSYICTVRENEEQGLHLATMYDDSFERIQDRVKYVTQVWEGTYEDYTARHFVQLVDWSRSGDLITMESNLLVAYTNTRGRSELLACGVYLDEIVVSDEGALFRAKKVVLDTTITPRYLVYPI